MDATKRRYLKRLQQWTYLVVMRANDPRSSAYISHYMPLTRWLELNRPQRRIS